MSARVGVILSGCGFLDGSEIHEAVAILFALDRRGATVLCMAPNLNQFHTINHLSQEPSKDTRNILVESARLSRGKIRDIQTVQADDLDALVFPGGFGAAKNLSTFASDGANCTINPEVARLTNAMHAARKPIGFACIAPVIAAKLFGSESPLLTIGSDPSTAQALRQMGARHQNTSPTDVCIDADHLLVTTPCYMNEVGPWTIYQGAERMVEEVLRFTSDTASMIRSQLADRPTPND